MSSDGYVSVPDAKHWIQHARLDCFDEMEPIIQLLSVPAQCHSDWLPVTKLAPFIDAKKSQGMTSVFLILVDGKWSVAIDGERVPHLLHFDPHAADSTRLSQSCAAVLHNAEQLVDLLLARKTYVASGAGIASHDLGYNHQVFPCN